MIFDDARFRQTESTECGLACIAACANILGSNAELSWFRQRFPPSARGANLKSLIEIASGIGMSARPIRCELEELRDLCLPAILHWEMNHFVVLLAAGRRHITIFDPAAGQRSFSWTAASSAFTGVALEVAATPDFEKRIERSPLSLLSLFKWTPQFRDSLIQAFILSLFLQTYIIISPLFIQVSIDKVAVHGDISLLNIIAAGFAILAMLNSIAEWMRALILQALAASLGWDMSRRLYNHMVRLPLPWFQRRRLADAQSRFQSLDPIKNLVSGGLIGALLDGILVFTTLIMMLVMSRSMAAVVFAGTASVLLIKILLIPISRRYSADTLVATISEQGKRLETFRAIQTIKVMGGESRREIEWLNKLASANGASLKSGMLSSASLAAQTLIESVSLIACIYIGIHQIISGTITSGILFAFVSYRTQFTARSSTLFDAIVNWHLLDIYTHRLADIVLSPKEEGIDDPVGAGDSLRGKVVLDRVSFAYSPSESPILKSVSLTIEAGDFAAIVGPSGSGKSTLLKVVSGLYAPTGGEVLFDGVPARMLGPKSVRQAMGVVMQDDELLPGSIAENVAFFDEKIDLERVWTCLDKAAVKAEVERMPMRLHTFVGDMGSTLSGGQRQRILLARALYKQPQILILDEATSHIDLARERMINDELKRLNVTRIVVAHRPQTIAAASRVFVLDDRAGIQEIFRNQSPLHEGSV